MTTENFLLKWYMIYIICDMWILRREKVLTNKLLSKNP